MGLFSKSKVSHDAEREALALEAAVMARIATITTTHDKQTFDEDQADLDLLASVSAGAEMAEPDRLVMSATLAPDGLVAALAMPAPIGDDTASVTDYTSMIPPPLTVRPQMHSLAASVMDDYALPDVPAGFAEMQSMAPMPSLDADLVPISLEFFLPPVTESPHAGLDEIMAFQTQPATNPSSIDIPVPPAVVEAAGDEPVLSVASWMEQPAEIGGFPLPATSAYAEPTDTVSELNTNPALISSNPFALTPEDLAASTLLQDTSKHLRSIGAVNILVAGQTGVGKSTLVNSVFGEAFAATAAGSPVTQHAQWFVSDTVPLRILDTRGLEAKDYSVTLNALRAEIDNSRAQHDEKNQLHMAWVCISTPSSRVQECEIDVLKLLNKYNIPTIIVLTKYDDDEDFPGIVGQIVTEKGAQFTAIVAVRALARKTRPTVGLDELVTATFTALPLAHKAAFAAAQKISRDLNRMTAETYVTVAASAAAAASVIPIPFADLATLAPIQTSMLVGISNAFGVTLERWQIMQLISTVLGCLAVTMAGGWIIGSVLKFIPGPGSVIGAMMNATVAGALTRTLGRTYIRFLYGFLEVNRRLPTADEIFDLFPTFYKARRKSVANAPA